MKTRELNAQELQQTNGGFIGGILGGDNGMLNISNGFQVGFQHTNDDGESTSFMLGDAFNLNFLAND